MGITDALTLTADVQVAFAAGYLGYVVAYAGYRKDHTAVDMVFLTLVFSVPATLVLLVPSPSGLWALAPISIILTILIAAFWRGVARSWWAQCMRASKISWSDDRESAWLGYIHEGRWNMESIHVWLKDGRQLRSLEVDRYKGFPDGPARLGNDGSIVMYVDEFKRPGEGWEKGSPVESGVGYCPRFIPSSEIVQVEITKK